MPHLVILYSSNLAEKVSISQLCDSLCEVMTAQTDTLGKRLFPTGGTRVLAYPAPHYSIADGGQAGRQIGESGEYGFVYLNLRMAEGRDHALISALGKALHEKLDCIFSSILHSHRVGITLHIDEKTPSFETKLNNLMPLFV